jgi:dihydroxyacetone kinase-like predicted kinase
MHVQVEERSERLSSNGHAPPVQRCGALAVCSGPGMATLFEGLGVQALDGGATLNPSTYELLAGIHGVPAEEVVVLPNSPNVFMAAERAAELSDKQVCVVPTRNQQAGLAAAIALLPDGGAEESAAAMRSALEHVRTGGVAPAARPDPNGRFAIGDAVGYVGDDLVAWGDPEATLRDVLARLADGAELVTCIAGDGAPLDAPAIEALVPAGVELEHSPGGQPSWWWLLSAE